MLRNASTLEGFTIGATDGDIGRVVDLYFDDQSWTIRHLVVDTGRWLAGRQVLISPMSFKAMDWDHSRIVANLTKQQVENSPSIETDKPILRQHEMDYYGYYGMPYYWTGPYRWGAWASPLDYGMVDTRNWLPGKKVLLSPEWIDRIRWADSTVSVNMPRQAIQDSPEYDPSRPIERAYEATLYDYYGRPRYWERDRAA